jgi:transposase-like protein
VVGWLNEQPVQIFQQFAGDHPARRDAVPEVPLSLRNVEDLLAERGIDISHETVRFWWNRFGPMFAGERPPEDSRHRTVHQRSSVWS